MKEYHDFLKEELDNFEGTFPKYVLYIPEFFKLLCQLTEEDLTIEEKRKINSALAYFVIPNDVIPEDIYGPAGYIDDIYVCCHVLNDLKEKFTLKKLSEMWEGEEDFEKVFEITFRESKKELEEKNLLNEVLKVSSLEDEK